MLLFYYRLLAQNEQTLSCAYAVNEASWKNVLEMRI